MPTTESFTATCEDGVVLHGLLLLPPKPKAIIQFNGGTATKKEFYLPFLYYLVEHNYACCLWDYRDSGDSAPASLAECDYYFRDYGMQDMPAIKRFLQERFENLPLLFFGHSVGGQQVGFIPDLSGVRGMVAFAVSTGYLWHMPMGYRLQAAFFFYLLTPISILLSGYVKAKPFGIMENLPRHVVREWRAWCARKDYLFDPAYYGKSVPLGHYAKLPFPVHLFWASDDPIANERSVATLWSHIKSPHGIELERLVPAELEEKSIGHFGFFKKRMRDKLWGRAVKKLDAFLQQH